MLTHKERRFTAQLAIIIFFNLLNIPLIFQIPFPPGISLAVADFIVTTIIAVQIVLTWLAVWAFSRRDQDVRVAATMELAP